MWDFMKSPLYQPITQNVLRSVDAFMKASDSAFFQSLLDEIRRHMPEGPAEAVDGMRAVANEAFWQCTRTIERERENKRRREKGERRKGTGRIGAAVAQKRVKPSLVAREAQSREGSSASTSGRRLAVCLRRR